MDLNVSPDLDAYCCYGLVLALGAWIGARQISGRLGGIRAIWFFPRTWLLFLAYLVVPVGLFWLLDRTGAINDTSFFAAVLVGVGYERIITGASDTLHWSASKSLVANRALTRGDRDYRRRHATIPGARGPGDEPQPRHPGTADAIDKNRSDCCESRPS